MSGLDTSQQITDEVVLHEGHVHAEEKAAKEAAAAKAEKSEPAKKD
ncbi:MAG: hypothetical protein QOE84_88 [Actinomycetota bacterium]|jgi:hypothetical protein|nr:hypothetical protein [Actinomycetota bacterium]